MDDNLAYMQSLATFTVATETRQTNYELSQLKDIVERTNNAITNGASNLVNQLKENKDAFERKLNGIESAIIDNGYNITIPLSEYDRLRQQASNFKEYEAYNELCIMEMDSLLKKSMKERDELISFVDDVIDAQQANNETAEKVKKESTEVASAIRNAAYRVRNGFTKKMILMSVTTVLFIIALITFMWVSMSFVDAGIEAKEISSYFNDVTASLDYQEKISPFTMETELMRLKERTLRYLSTLYIDAQTTNHNVVVLMTTLGSTIIISIITVCAYIYLSIRQIDDILENHIIQVEVKDEVN